jgi:hypothetical protein
MYAGIGCILLPIESLAGFREFWIVRCPWRVWHYEYTSPSLFSLKLHHGDPHPYIRIAMASTAKPPDPMPCALTAVLLPESRAHGCHMQKTLFPGPAPRVHAGHTCSARACVHGALMRRGRASGVQAKPWVPGGGAWHRG